MHNELFSDGNTLNKLKGTLLKFQYSSSFCHIIQFYIAAAGGGQLPDVLQEAQIQVLALADCQERYSSTPYQVYDESICVFKLSDNDDHTGSCYVSSYSGHRCLLRYYVLFFFRIWTYAIITFAG